MLSRLIGQTTPNSGESRINVLFYFVKNLRRTTEHVSTTMGQGSRKSS